MLAHLMFGQEPRRMMLAGCGGGGIARWFSAVSPQTGGIALERSGEVVRIAREHFQFPTSEQHWTLEHADVRDRLPDYSQSLDFILVDIAVQGYSPNWLSEMDFLRHCRAALTDDGVLTVNLLPRNPEEFAVQLSRIRRVFSQQTLCLSVPQHDNVLVLAFNTAPDLAGLEDRLPERQQRWGLEFESLLARMRRENPVGSGIF
jgi:spermidine synthase